MILPAPAEFEPFIELTFRRYDAIIAPLVAAYFSNLREAGATSFFANDVARLDMVVNTLGLDHAGAARLDGHLSLLGGRHRKREKPR